MYGQAPNGLIPHIHGPLGIANPSGGSTGAAGATLAYVGAAGHTDPASVDPSIDISSTGRQVGDLLVWINLADNREYADAYRPAGWQWAQSNNQSSVLITNVFTRTSDGTETTLSIGDNDSMASVCVVLRGATLTDVQTTNGSQDPPAVTCDSGALALVVAADRAGTDVTVTYPSGYTEAATAYNSQGLDFALRVGYKASASANENPGAFSDWTNGTNYNVSTIAFHQTV